MHNPQGSWGYALDASFDAGRVYYHKLTIRRNARKHNTTRRTTITKYLKAYEKLFRVQNNGTH